MATCIKIRLIWGKGFLKVLVIYIKKLRSNHSNITTLRLQDKILTSSIDKANALNEQFLSVFTQENPDIPTLPLNQLPETDSINFSSNGIKCILENLDPSKKAVQLWWVFIWRKLLECFWRWSMSLHDLFSIYSSLFTSRINNQYIWIFGMQSHVVYI